MIPVKMGATDLNDNVANASNYFYECWMTYISCWTCVIICLMYVLMVFKTLLLSLENKKRHVARI